MNARAFERVEKDFSNIRNRWIYTFGSIFLDHDINKFDDIDNVMDHLIGLGMRCKWAVLP